MGYRGKTVARAEARRMRAAGRTLADIAEELDVSKGSVSVWVRDVPFVPGPRRPSVRGPNILEQAKEAEIARLLEEGRARIGELSGREFLVAGAALYAGEGAKSGPVKFANTDPGMIAFFVGWLRHFFDIDEGRLRACVYLHDGLDIDAATAFWSGLTGIPPSQFTKPYRAKADPTMRLSKHPYGCAYVMYHSMRTHREVMGLVAALLSSAGGIPG